MKFNIKSVRQYIKKPLVIDRIYAAAELSRACDRIEELETALLKIYNYRSNVPDWNMVMAIAGDAIDPMDIVLSNADTLADEVQECIATFTGVKLNSGQRIAMDLLVKKLEEYRRKK